MSTLRHSALFYLGQTLATGQGDVIPILDEISGYGSATIPGTGVCIPPKESLSGEGVSAVSVGSITGFLPVVSGVGVSDVLVGGFGQVTPQREGIQGQGIVPFSLGTVNQGQFISGYGSSAYIVGVGTTKPHKCLVSGVGNSSFVAVKGPLVFVPQKEQVGGFGSAGANSGIGNTRERRHSVSGDGLSAWTLSISGNGAVTPKIGRVFGQGKSAYVEPITAVGRVTGLRPVVSSKAWLLVVGNGSIEQMASVKAFGTVQRTTGTIQFSRNTVAAATGQPQQTAPITHHRESTTTAGGQAPQQPATPLMFSR